MAEEVHYIRFENLTTGSIFKIGLISNIAIWSIFGLLLGVAGLAGYDTVQFNEQYVHGFGALLMGLVVAGIFSVFGALLLLLGGLLARLISRRFSWGRLRVIIEMPVPPGEAG